MKINVMTFQPSDEGLKTFLGASVGGDRTSVLFWKPAYLRINLILLIINLDYSRHLKRGNNITTHTVKQQGGKKDFTAKQVRKISDQKSVHGLLAPMQRSSPS